MLVVVTACFGLLCICALVWLFVGLDCLLCLLLCCYLIRLLLCLFRIDWLLSCWSSVVVWILLSFDCCYCWLVVFIIVLFYSFVVAFILFTRGLFIVYVVCVWVVLRFWVVMICLSCFYVLLPDLFARLWLLFALV